MRMRKKKHGEERINACAELRICDPALMLSGFDKIFPSSAPVHMEIGCGKGKFACDMAKKYADVNFIAVEKVPDVCCVALEKAMAQKDERTIDNLRFIIGDAKTLEETVPENSLDCIYLNFSDPWPKKGHAKRRLTYRSFLEIYKKLLKPGAAIYFKTDNRILFDYSLETFKACGFRLEKLTYDLHNSEYEKDNLHTEYEDNFSAKGFPINRVEA
ncbi:MAG: tRNA (guanosine(46)-N7)-methyltransferase TrmB, partial [Clostridia bacterium]|nr:tRNA (guanosine(46)-N7)-methyltransferase TrmB [Clostridia bacterium]